MIKVLVIDDDEINNFLCSKVIRLAGFTDDVVTFKSADDAMDSLNQHLLVGQSELPDLIFLDINMPLKNGWDFLDDFSSIAGKIEKKVKIFMLSSSVYKDDIQRAQSSPLVTDYITKPLTEETLKNIKSRHFV